MSNKDGVAKNLERVKEGLDDVLVEWREQTSKVRAAWGRREYIRVLHHASGYLEAALQHASKLWFYTWVPKWAFVAYLIWWA